MNQAIDNQKSADVIYLDFRKAFDSVPHSQLLFKLWQIGIVGPLWKLLRCYLTNRLHYISIDDHQSGTLPVTSGVPQGSILGPLLFQIYINDLPGCINNSDCLLFADDAKIIRVIPNLQDQLLLQEDLHSTEQWCSAWNLQLNSDKCHVLKFMLNKAVLTTDQISHYSLAGNIISFSNSETDLGIVVRSDLLWSEHYKKYQPKHITHYI